VATNAPPNPGETPSLRARSRAAGLAPDPDDPGDGSDLLPLLRGEGRPDRDALFWHYPNYAFHRSNRLGSAVRVGRYKLLEFFDDDSVELYDLEKDLGETTNLADEQPQRAAEMRARLKAWREASGAKLPRPKSP